MSATSSPAIAGPSSSLGRIYGLGSVFAKSLRDSRRAVLLVSALLALIFIGVSKAIVTEFNTPQSRAELDALVAATPPILQGLAGKLVNVGTLGGYLQYKYGTFFPVVLSMWSILALSGTLASEAQRGSLEFVLAGPRSRARVAFEKLSAHLVGLFIAFLFSFVSLAIAGSVFPVLPGDEISLTSAFGYSIWLVLLVLAAGSVAFTLASYIGRGAAAGIAGFLTLAGFLASGYQTAVPELGALAKLSWFGWTSDHVALGGQYDWASVALVAVFDIVVLAIGIEAFNRRDLAATSKVPTLSLPRALVGLRGPFTRGIAINLPAALAWGFGIGLFGLLMAGSARSFIDQLDPNTQIGRMLASLFPNIDFASVGGFLQLLFIEMGIVMIGLAAATLVAGWASDESSGRLEMLLSVPLARARWAVSSALAMVVDMALLVVLVAIGIGLGGLSTGGDLLTPMLGSLVLAFYGWALIGIGFGVGGYLGPRWATTSVIVFFLLTWFVQLLGPLLNLPEVIQQLALTAHYGEPLVGVWDWGGVLLSIGIAIAGLAIGAWGFARRDLRD